MRKVKSEKRKVKSDALRAFNCCAVEWLSCLIVGWKLMADC